MPPLSGYGTRLGVLPADLGQATLPALPAAQLSGRRLEMAWQRTFHSRYARPRPNGGLGDPRRKPDRSVCRLRFGPRFGLDPLDWRSPQAPSPFLGRLPDGLGNPPTGLVCLDPFPDAGLFGFGSGYGRKNPRGILFRCRLGCRTGFGFQAGDGLPECIIESLAPNPSGTFRARRGPSGSPQAAEPGLLHHNYEFWGGTMSTRTSMKHNLLTLQLTLSKALMARDTETSSTIMAAHWHCSGTARYRPLLSKCMVNV